MAIKRVIDGINLEFADETQASVIEKMVNDAKSASKAATDAATAATKRATDAEAEVVTLKAANEKLVADHAAKVKDLEGKILKAGELDALVAERTKVIADSLGLVPEMKTDGKSVQQIRAEVLASVLAADDGSLTTVAKAALGGIEPAKADPARACVAFDAVVAHAATLAGDGDEPATPAAARDSAVAAALAGGARRPKAPVGRALWMHRQQHGTQDPAAK